jgi:hypothetical protein
MKNNSYKFQNEISSQDLKQTASNDNKLMYSINFSILFEKKRDCQKFFKLAKSDFTLSSRTANLFTVSICNTVEQATIAKANAFLKIAKNCEFSILSTFTYHN